MWDSKEWASQVDALEDQIIDLRRYFHKNAELSEKEFNTQSKICKIMEEENIPYKKIADTGVMAIVTSSKDGKTIGVRADMDALPITEKNDLPFASVNPGTMHACGHDAHMAIAVFCAKVLNNNKDRWHGSIKFFFQPAEETIGGAERMVQEGCLKNPDVDYCIGLHVMPHLEVGKIELKPGALNAACDSFTINVKGKSGHGAVPDKCVDAIVISAQIITAIESIVSRNVSPLESAVLTIGSIQGGVAGNVIAGEVTMSGTLRTPNSVLRSKIQQKIRSLSESFASAMGGSAEVEFIDGYPPVVNDVDLVSTLSKELKNFLGEENVIMRETMSMGGEDFSFFGEKVPSMFYHVGCKPCDRDRYLLHTSDFDIDEACLSLGVKTNIAIVLNLLK